MNVFELQDVTYLHKNGHKALDGINFCVARGEAVSILGANGCGKSTLLYIMQGLLKPASGSLRVFSEDGFTDGCRARISLLFQNSQAQLFSLSVWDELMFGPLHLRAMELEAARQRAGEVMELLGIERLKDRSPWQLSGGEMKKVALGACLSTNPDVFLLDEPTSGLDPRSQVELVELIAALKKAGKTIITATHDLHIIADISDRAIIMGENHRVLLEGGPRELLREHDLLLNANLIHEHVHAHDGYEHEHTHYGPHEHHEHAHGHGGHEHEAGHDHEGHGEEHAHEHAHEIGETGTGEDKVHEDGQDARLTEVKEKLKILLPHWAGHNIEHAHTYMEWAQKAQSAGADELALTLREIAKEGERLNALFDRAKKMLEG